MLEHMSMCTSLVLYCRVAVLLGAVLQVHSQVRKSCMTSVRQQADMHVCVCIELTLQWRILSHVQCVCVCVCVRVCACMRACV